MLLADYRELVAAFEQAGWRAFMTGAGDLAQALANVFAGGES